MRMVMGNYLQMAKEQQVLALLELDWSYRRIGAEIGVRRETVGRYDAARRAKRPTCSPALMPPRPRAAGTRRWTMRQMRPKCSQAPR